MLWKGDAEGHSDVITSKTVFKLIYVLKIDDNCIFCAAVVQIWDDDPVERFHVQT